MLRPRRRPRRVGIVGRGTGGTATEAAESSAEEGDDSAAVAAAATTTTELLVRRRFVRVRRAALLSAAALARVLDRDDDDDGAARGGFACFDCLRRRRGIEGVGEDLSLRRRVRDETVPRPQPWEMDDLGVLLLHVGRSTRGRRGCHFKKGGGDDDDDGAAKTK